MNANPSEKRLNKGYKVKDKFYQKAKRRADKEGGSLASILECVVIAYSYGMDIVAESNSSPKKYMPIEEAAAPVKPKIGL